MTNELTQLFEIWERIKGLDESMIEKENFVETWERLCLQIQIQLILAKDEKTRYLNAIAVLSDQIYEYYRKRRRLTFFLRFFLDKLGDLLKEREIPEKYRRSELKITVVSSANSVVTQLIKSQIQGGLFEALRSALKDISLNSEPSLHIIDFLRSLADWLKRKKVISAEYLIDYLVLVDFNHPAFLEYMFDIYESPQLAVADSEGLIQIERNLRTKQLHLEMLRLRSTSSLLNGLESVATKLLVLLATQLSWICNRSKNEFGGNCNPNWSNSNQSDSKGEPIARKILSKWPADKSDLIELVYGLYIYMRSRGSHITIAALVKWCEDAFGVNLARYSHRFAEIKMRKSTRPSKFLDAMVNEFLNYVEQGNAFEPDLNR
ncbi:hypothetical protein CKK33_17475 [Mucilaginibacter sp. MD40]|uniref:RteC domain-containing protein n=1 Tax=Mucilaginibacter sp. MD40 TaxID=2029590 RepID=UPI000BACD41B|nr:RteC domain-containing protein [Mucilaginibacter sp. MD40]PAW95193.1 hypothetical protein CKK33_17475 [Mucilaginibacter sp. MD40]